jgi:hypothetical protein
MLRSEPQRTMHAVAAAPPQPPASKRKCAARNIETFMDAFHSGADAIVEVVHTPRAALGGSGGQCGQTEGAAGAGRALRVQTLTRADGLETQLDSAGRRTGQGRP